MFYRSAAVLALVTVSSTALPARQTSPGAGPIIVLETARGPIELETYPEEAPKTVAEAVINKKAA